MQTLLQRVDHVVAVVDDFDAARQAWIEAGCPVVYDGQMPTHRDCAFSIGPINLEILSSEAFDGWPALADWCRQAGRRPGLQVAALDPGDLDTAVATLRTRGLAPSEPREGRLLGPDGAPTEFRWRNSYLDGLRGLLPGLPSFLCEFVAPRRHLGRALPDSPLQLVELRVGQADPAETALAWERVLEAAAIQDAGSYRFLLGDVPVRIAPGEGLAVVLRAEQAGIAVRDLSALVPGVEIAATPRT